MTAEEIIASLGLKPLPREGGFYAETYRSGEILAVEGRGPRPAGTAIFYLLTPETRSAFHRLGSDEMWHFYLGDPIQLVNLGERGSGEIAVLGSDVSSGQHLQHMIAAGHWQGARLIPGGRFALLGTTMAPGFAWEDYEAADLGDLIARYPRFAEVIAAWEIQP